MTRSVARYHFELSCPSCRGILEPVASGTPGLDSRAVARCRPCRRHYALVVEIRDVTEEVGVPFDSRAGRKRAMRARQKADKAGERAA